MRIMWVTFAPVGKASEIFYDRPTQSGGWVDASMNALLPQLRTGEMQLDIVSLGESCRTVCDELTGVVYHMLALPRLRGKRNVAQAVPVWKELLDKRRPDLIQIWGTEFTFGLDVMDAAGNIPVCCFIQGVMASLVAHPLGDISETYLMRQLCITAYPKLWSLRKWRRIDAAQTTYEAQLAQRAAGLLVDSQWARGQYSQYTNKFYTVPLAANQCFREKHWSLENCKKHSLFTVAGGADPQKGVHDAVLAAAQLKRKYPDIRLYIPGSISYRRPHFLFDSIYIRHLRKLIEKNKLQENVVFVGAMSPEEMAQHMADANVFVMPSCVENHSSTLREAMTVGCPSISAAVGSGPELIETGKNGYLYRYHEEQTLAYYIDQLFSDDSLAQRFSMAGRIAVTEKYPQEKIGEMLREAYTKILDESIK